MSQRDVTSGDPAGVVADQRHVHEAVGQREVGVMVGCLRGRTDGLDQRQTRREVAGAEPCPQHRHELAPVNQSGSLNLGKSESGIAHALHGATAGRGAASPGARHELLDVSGSGCRLSLIHI